MNIDIPTLFVLVAMICFVLGAVFFSAWYRDRGDRLALRASAGPVAIAIGVALLLMRGAVPDWLSIIVANSLLMTGIGLIWSAIRVLEGRSAPAAGTLAGTIVWLVACGVPAFFAAVEWRIALLSSIAAGYSLAAGFEFWRGRTETLHARMPMVALCFAHAAVVFVRALAILIVPLAGGPLDGNWLQNLFMMEAPLFLIAAAFLGVSMVRERAERDLRRTAEIDELTDVANRRAFLAKSRLLMDEAGKKDQSVVLLLFDLDHFKAINDRFGHAAGDRTLRRFAEIGSAAIRATDLFGRIGGEEFAALLPGCDAVTAQRIADRIRGEISSKAIVHGGIQVPATVSVGVASMVGRGADLEALMARADEALYQSKRAGRDRVSGSLAAAG
jgi:diguanylate cyclase (GGDEF)-like protein